MLDKLSFLSEVAAHSEVPFNGDQKAAVESIYDFLFTGGERSAFVLCGYAGTGKTTLIGALIRWLHAVHRKTVLMAPTGRSAKVLAAVSKYPASTIHRRIYSVKQDDFGRISTTLARNTSERTIFIVDEASMIGDGSLDEGLSRRSLLEDLMEYVYSGVRCRLIVIGDEAQLPPVGMELSPALDQSYLSRILRGNVFGATLREVVRQEENSLILENATMLRQLLEEEKYEELHLKLEDNGDVRSLDAAELQDHLESDFSGSESEEAVIICRSNKDAYRFNVQIRSRILYREELIEGGDRMMIVKNNYFWKVPGRKMDFLANGDMIEVERVIDRSSFGPFQFAECTVRLIDQPGESFDLILLLNSIAYEGPSLPSKELYSLREQMMASGDVDAMDPEEKFFQNPYFNAVQVKYAYAVTCHKSQGGQWKHVYVHQGYLPPDGLDRSYFRWLYTAITRATQHLYLVGFHPRFLVND